MQNEEDKFMKETNVFDVLIVGSGVAGMYGALNFPSDKRILMLSKYDIETSSSNLAQGGVAAVLSLEDDSYELHFEDTLIAGRNANDPGAVDILVHEGPGDVCKVMEYGVDFDRNEDGELDKTLEGGHSRRRIVHYKDCTGAELVRKLGAQAGRRENITFSDNTTLVSLKKIENGFAALLLRDGAYFPVYASYCILATGGIGRVYKYTTNPKASTGDGIRLACELGAKIKNVSYIQFHPTAFNSENGEQFLISESVRGEGAHLLNCDKERFMQNYDARLELAPRDVVSQSIMLESARTGSDRFYLDITHEDADFLRGRFPGIYEGCLKYGVDITRDLIPVYPCQHYLMGGIEVNEHSKTDVEGLYACGECANTGVHGKNRLASNSLLEALVFSRRAAEDILKAMETGVSVTPVCIKPRTEGKDVDPHLADEIRNIMQRSHFVLPDKEKAKAGLGEITEILADLRNETYALTTEYVETLSLAAVAYLVLTEAAE